MSTGLRDGVGNRRRDCWFFNGCLDHAPNDLRVLRRCPLVLLEFVTKLSKCNMYVQSQYNVAGDCYVLP